MIETAPPAQPVATGRPVRRRLIGAGVAVLALILAVGGVAAVRTWRQYSAAPGLYCMCGLVWAAPDSSRVRESTAGGHSAMNVPADPDRRQAFYVDIDNPSSVPQTVLGLAHPGPSGYRFQLQVSPSGYDSGKTEDELAYTDQPVRIAPHGEATLKFSFRAECLSPGGQLVWDALDLRVKSGWFTRTEHIEFMDTSFVVVGTTASTRCPS